MAAGSQGGHSVRLAPLPGLPRKIVLRTHDPQQDLVSAALHRDRAWEPFESRLLLACLQPGAVAVDVGANLGYFSLLFALGVEAPGPVFAFEPAADNYRLLRENLALNGCAGRVTAVQAGLSDTARSRALYRSRDNLGDHALYPGGGLRDVEHIDLLQGADFLQRHVDRIDVLKVDTQGTELQVLRGLAPLLRRSADIAMMVELTPAALRRSGGSGRQLVEFVAGLALPLYIVDHVAQRLVPESPEALITWCGNVDATPGDEGFMNIFAGLAPAGL
jgi:FkbM family methyltransferase